MKNKFFPMGILLFVILIFPSCRVASDRISLVHEEEAERVDVKAGEGLFTSLLYGSSLEKPVLFPILTGSAIPVTRGFPLAPRAGERTDHPHQVGMWFNFGDVNGYDFWNNSSAIPEERKPHYGKIVTQSVSVKNGRDPAIRTLALWQVPDSAGAWLSLLEENSVYRFSIAPGIRTIERDILLRALDRKVTLTDNKEGLFAIRVARQFEMPGRQPLVLTDSRGIPTEVPVLDNEGVQGMYESSEGITGEEVWGTRASWVKLGTRLAGESVTLVLFDHPDNPGHPPCWHARPYGLFACNNLGQAAFIPGADTLVTVLQPGDSLQFRYRFTIYTGTDPSLETLNAEFREFAEGKEGEGT